MKEFDENEAIIAMRQAVPEAKKALYVDDELLLVLDIIFDWYEDNGYLNIDADSEETSQEMTSKLIAHVRKLLAADKDSIISPDDAQALVEAEINYENSLDPFED